MCKHSSVILLMSMLLVTPLAAVVPNPDNDQPIDLVLCLDTSNSMDGLIESAKRKLWDIVNTLGEASPTPMLRVALLSYGNKDYDPRNGWVRLEQNLTTNLDDISTKLFALRTHGGTEYVGRVSRDALARLHWSENPRALKLMFVCGNESVVQDPDVNLEKLAKRAKKARVVINTIYCGSKVDNIAPGWNVFAQQAGGKGLCIDQDAAVREKGIFTPQDDKLLGLNRKLNETYLDYGGMRPSRLIRSAAVQQRVVDEYAIKANVQTAIARIRTKASAHYRNAEWDLVDRMAKDPEFKLEQLKGNQIPKVLRELPKEKWGDYVQNKAKEREKIKKQIVELSKERAEYLRKQGRKQPNQQTDPEQAFDVAIREVLIEQCKAGGFKLKD